MRVCQLRMEFMQENNKASGNLHNWRYVHTEVVEHYRLLPNSIVVLPIMMKNYYLHSLRFF